ncbi:MAG: nitrate/nitrite transporter NrtS [Porticoccus sp.]|nr:nitrate/nitrite transporter NrtS [Porticoccus sp.]MBQ0806843.1 nitrate/nitrite transporter NrtS [Porticoccus sp.]
MPADIRRTAIKVALIVGTLLALINYGDKVLMSTMNTTDWLKLALTYLVPYGVSWYSAARLQKITIN